MKALPKAELSQLRTCRLAQQPANPLILAMATCSFILPLLLPLFQGATCFITKAPTPGRHDLLTRPPLLKSSKAVVEPESASVSDIANEVSESPSLDADTRIHTLILCRHGDSIWNGGHPGFSETFTGWTDVELSPRGVNEATMTAQLLAATYPFGIDACFTSILQRARLTAHECVWAYGDMPSGVQPAKFVSDYRLNERHYGALQGFVKADVEAGLYGHDPNDVEGWRRGWYAVPPLLDDDDPRRQEEIRIFGHYCGGAENVPRGESLEMVARDRIQPFLDEVLTPTLDRAVDDRVDSQSDNNPIEGGTGLVVAHANSLRALIGIICQVDNDEMKLKKVEQMKIQTGVPLVLRYQHSVMPDGSVKIRACGQELKGEELAEGLPIYPLSIIPSSRA